MPKRSIYFQDDLLPELEAEAVKDQRSLSQWINVTLRAVLKARKTAPDAQPSSPGPTHTEQESE